MLWSRSGDSYHVIGRVEGLLGMVMQAAFSPDGARCAFGTDAGQVVIHDGATGERVGAADLRQGWISSIAWSPAGDRLAASTLRGSIQVFDRDCRLHRTLRGGRFEVVWASGGEEIMTLGFSDVFRSRVDRPELMIGHQEILYCATPLGTSGRTLTCGKDAFALVWQDGRRVAELRDPELAPSWMLHGAMNARGDIVICSVDGRVRRYGPDGTLLARSRKLGTFAYQALPLPDGRVVVARLDEPGAVVLDEDLQEAQPLAGASGDARGAVTPDGRWLAVVGCLDHRIVVFDMQQQPPVLHRQFEVESPWRCSAEAIAPDGGAVVVGSQGWLDRFDLHTGEHLRWRAHDGPILGVDIDDRGRIASCGSDMTAAVWSSTGVRLARLRGHTGSIWTVYFTPDGRHLLTGSEDGSARLWPLDEDLVLELAKNRLRPADRVPELALRAELVGDLLERR